MVRRYYRRTPRSNNRDKYSVENTVCTTPVSTEWTDVPATDLTLASKQFPIAIVAPSDTQGMRKVKHLTLSFSSPTDVPIYYALVYVPGGYEPSYINYPALGNAISLYEPNQFVMASGVLDFTGGPLRIRTPLARNLNSGDSIYLILAAQATGSTIYSIYINCQYAITLQ